MTPLTCAQVDALLELYSAGACEPEERRVVEDHLASCPACSASLDKANHLVGLLDLHYQIPNRLSRLQQRLRQEPAGRHQPGRVVVRRFMALAALLLVTLGLCSLLLPWGQDVSPGLQLTASLDLAALKREALHPLPMADNPAAHFAQRLITALDLRLSLANTGARPIRLDLVHGLVRFTLTDPAGHTVQGTLPPKAPVAHRDDVLLQPGDRFVLPVSQFAEPDRPVVLARPGDYTLVIRYTFDWWDPENGAVRKQTLEAAPVWFSVAGPAP